MPKQSLINRVRASTPGLPRSAREALSSLQVLATLRAQGWHKSVTGASAGGPRGEPWPWLTYAAADWLQQVLTAQTRVFEYGAGSSTSWFARHAKEIVAVEHDKEWFGRVPQPMNGRILFRPHTGDWWGTEEDHPYVRALADRAPWDVIVIDGIARTACARIATDHLAHTGLVILDDTNDEHSIAAQRELSRRGLGRLDFWGFKPGAGTRACTTVYGRDFNPWLINAAAYVGRQPPALGR
jgi:hypothetical protein